MENLALHDELSRPKKKGVIIKVCNQKTNKVGLGSSRTQGLSGLETCQDSRTIRSPIQVFFLSTTMSVQVGRGGQK